MRKLTWCIFLLLASLHSWAGDAADSLATHTSDPVYNADNWHWGIFYYSKTDTRIFPPKPHGFGWTINFANPFSVGALVLLIVALYILFGKRKKR